MRFASVADVDAIAALHAERIAEGFLVTLGPAFLGRLYRRIAAVAARVRARRRSAPVRCSEPRCSASAASSPWPRTPARCTASSCCATASSPGSPRRGGSCVRRVRCRRRCGTASAAAANAETRGGGRGAVDRRGGRPREAGDRDPARAGRGRGAGATRRGIRAGGHGNRQPRGRARVRAGRVPAERRRRSAPRCHATVARMALIAGFVVAVLATPLAALLATRRRSRRPARTAEGPRPAGAVPRRVWRCCVALIGPVAGARPSLLVPLGAGRRVGRRRRRDRSSAGVAPRRGGRHRCRGGVGRGAARRRARRCWASWSCSCSSTR